MEFYVFSFCFFLFKDVLIIYVEVLEKKVFYVFRLFISNRWGVYYSNMLFEWFRYTFRKGVIKRYYLYEGVFFVEFYVVYDRIFSILWGFFG